MVDQLTDEAIIRELQDPANVAAILGCGGETPRGALCQSCQWARIGKSGACEYLSPTEDCLGFAAIFCLDATGMSTRLEQIITGISGETLNEVA